MVALVDSPGGFSSLTAGAQGTVVCGTTLGEPSLLVKWDNWTHGHDGLGNCTCGGAPTATNDHRYVGCDEVGRIIGAVTNVTQGTTYGTIQSALDNATSGDAILLTAGTFNEDNIVFPNGLDVTITGLGPDLTIIDGGGAADQNPILNMALTGQTSATVISALTLHNGVNTTITGGGAVVIAGTSPVFRGVHFRDNTGPGGNAGAAHLIASGAASPRFERCIFSGASGAFDAIGTGGGTSNIVMLQCLVAQSATFQAVRLEGNQHLVVNCTISGFETNWGNALQSFAGTVDASNSVFDGLISSGSGVITTNRCLYAGATGDNIDAAPTFVDAMNGDYRLADASLGTDAADFDAYLAAGGGLVDLAGASRRSDFCVADTGVGGIPYLDMGTYESQDDGNDSDGDAIGDQCDQCPNSPNVYNLTQNTYHPSIQDGLSAALNGDVIELGACVFVEDNIFLPNSTDITLRGAGMDQTIIDGDGFNSPEGPIIVIPGGQTIATEISDLTLRNGRSISGDVPGAMALLAPATVRRVKFTGSTGRESLRTNTSGTVLIDQCIFTGNSAVSETVFTRNGIVDLVQCLFYGNSPGTQVVRESSSGKTSLINCTVVSFAHDSVIARSGAEVDLVNTVLTMITPNFSSGVLNISRCLFPGAGGNNINGAPTFVNAAGGDYRLAPGSLGIDAADYDSYVAAGGGPTDLAAAPRTFDSCVTDAGTGETTHLDMGAYETQSDGPDTDSDSIPDLCDPCAGGATTGDTDGDGDVDADDYGRFNECLAGPVGGLGNGCECFDFDDDNDNDLLDFAELQTLLAP